jgi:ABC-type transport system substrate-binding protein
MTLNDPAAVYRKGSATYHLRTGYYNAGAEPLWEAVAREVDQNKRAELMRKANDLLLKVNAHPLLY